MIIADSPSDDIQEGVFTKAQYGILRQMAGQVGLPLKNTPTTTVFPEHVTSFYSITTNEPDKIQGKTALLPGRYVHEKYCFVLPKLQAQIKATNPNLILGLGPLAAWALLNVKAVKSVRGAPTKSLFGPKVICTYHPAEVLRDYSLRPITISDFAKAVRELAFPEIRRPSRKLWLEPTLADLYEFERLHIEPAEKLSIDIETAKRQITCIGFSPRDDLALVIPITCKAKPDGNYWSLGDELKVWEWIRKQCRRSISVVGQNFLYDANFLWTSYGIPVPSMGEDTMLLHHAMQPELEKSLGFLGSIYTDEPPWKMMRKTETKKRED